MKYLAVLLLIPVFAFSALPAFADEGSGGNGSGEHPSFSFPRLLPRKDEMHASSSLEAKFEDASSTHPRIQELKDRLEEKKIRFASTTELLKAKLDDRIKEMVIKRAQNMADLFDAMIDRLNKIADRIQARITELKAQGTDTTDAEAKLAIAKTDIQAAIDAGAKVKVAFKAALDGGTPREDIKNNVKPLLKDVKDAIRVAHQALMDAAKALPGGIGKHEGENREATTTESN